jgi:hypothetical protein
MTLADVSNSDPEPYFFLLFPVFFVGMWCLVCFIISLTGGWGALGKRFRADRAPMGIVFYGQSAQFRHFTNYNSCLSIIVAKEGLYLKVWPMFRMGHPPLLIPWEEIGAAKHHQFLWVRRVSFPVGRPQITTIRISAKVFAQFPPEAKR